MSSPALSSVLGDISSGLAREIARGQGPVKWCRSCGRKHARRAGCGLTTIAVKAKSGHVVERRARAPRGG